MFVIFWEEHGIIRRSSGHVARFRREGVLGPVLITTAIINIRSIKDFLEVALRYAMEHTDKLQANAALQQAGMVHDTLFDMREEL